MADLYQDLLKDTSKSYEDGNYFLVTITDLNPNTSYPLQFRWTYKDATKNDNWSAVRLITTPGESEPNTPKFTSSNVDDTKPEKLIITWSGISDDNTPITNYDRIDVYIDGAPFDGTKVAYSFKAPGTTIIPAPAGTYNIVLYAVSKTGKLSPVSSYVEAIVEANAIPVVAPETPTAPTLTKGLASIIVEWDGKRYDNQNFSVGSFAGAKVFIGTTSGFTPSNNNWVHTLNFANGSNKVSIGVGTIIDKSTNATLQYGTPYYIKIDTINADGISNNNPISASGGPITVDKLPASEIKTGILSADASITAGTDNGARVVMSGGASPFVIYGTNGTTKLLEFIGGSTGTLSINGSGTFTGNLSIGTSPNIFKAEPATGIWLGGDGTYANADFRVANNGVLRARAGTIGGWTLGGTYLQNSSSNPTLKIDLGGITVGSTTSPYLDITSSSITHRKADGTASNKFTIGMADGSTSTIAGWSISNDTLSSPSGNVLFYSAGKTGDTSLRIQAGSNGQFKVYDDGSIVATNATVSGTITASSFTSPNNTVSINTDAVLGDSIIFSQPSYPVIGAISSTSYDFSISGAKYNFITFITDGGIRISAGSDSGYGNYINFMGNLIWPSSPSSNASNIYMAYSSPATNLALRNSIALTSATATSTGITDGATVATWGGGGIDWVNGDVVFTY